MRFEKNALNKLLNHTALLNNVTLKKKKIL